MIELKWDIVKLKKLQCKRHREFLIALIVL